MKKIVIAAGILLLSFAVMLCHSFYISSFTQNLTSLLASAKSNTEGNNWTAAEELTQAAWEQWTSADIYLHILLRHSETDAVYTGFGEVSELIRGRERDEYSAANARLIARLELLAEAEQLSLKNIL